eukprot:363835-Chlamydomonas_euryale.AAC.2
MESVHERPVADARIERPVSTSVLSPSSSLRLPWPPPQPPLPSSAQPPSRTGEAPTSQLIRADMSRPLPPPPLPPSWPPPLLTLPPGVPQPLLAVPIVKASPPLTLPPGAPQPPLAVPIVKASPPLALPPSLAAAAMTPLQDD